MKKNVLNFWFFAALLCGLSLTVTSCKDDDNDNGSNGDESEIVVAPTETEEAKAALNWLANMTNVEEFTDDWASKTYEPTIGVESKNEANTRVVVVADIDYARMNFSSISGIDPDKLSSVQSQTIDGVGTVTWTPSAADANNLATVDVNTKLIPHLSKIVYCTMEQAGDNGSTFDGTAYFRFGDVLEDQGGYYWVCVKPAFGTGKAAQQQGYWINVFNRDEKNGQGTDGIVPPIPKANICSDYDEKYNGNTILLPTKLKSTKEMTHNLANLVWALLDPESYEEAVADDDIGLGGYDYEYNGKKFCQRVAEQWKMKGIWQILFNRTYEQMKQMTKLNFYYEGYHFTPKIHLGSSNLGCATVMGTKKYEPNYATTYNQDSEKNLEMKEKGAGFDMRRYCSDPDQNADCASSDKAGYAPARQFSDTEGYWIVRQKTSSDLAGTFLHPSVYISLKNTAEIYRYNAAYGVVVGKDTPVEEEDTYGNDVVSNAPARGEAGTYMIGDVVMNKYQEKANWFCISGSPYHKDLLKNVTDHTAWFISIDANADKSLIKEGSYNLLSEEDLPEFVCRFMTLIMYLESLQNEYQADFEKGILGKVGQHILDYAKVDLRQLMSSVDSTWTFTNYKQQKQYASISTSYAFNVAYKSANDDDASNPHIARCIIDITQAGTHRTACIAKSGHNIENWRYLCYKNYEAYDPDRVTMTDDEASVGMTKWQALWPVTDDVMRLKDVTNQAMINKYAKGDKWQKSPRTTAETSVTKDDYYWENGKFASNKTSIFKEPVLFVHVMKVTDEGGPTPTLKSQEGTELKIVHMQNDRKLYNGYSQALWSAPYSRDSQSSFFLNNKLFPVKKIAGLE